MGLIYFHRVLIAAGILFSGFYAYWEYLGYQKDNVKNIQSLYIAIVFCVIMLGFSVYLYYLVRFYGKK